MTETKISEFDQSTWSCKTTQSSLAYQLAKDDINLFIKNYIPYE